MENISEQLGVGIKVEAANSEQASEVGKTHDKKSFSTNFPPIIVNIFFSGWEQALCSGQQNINNESFPDIVKYTGFLCPGT